MTSAPVGWEKQKSRGGKMDFPGDTVGKNPPADRGDMGVIFGPHAVE